MTLAEGNIVTTTNGVSDGGKVGYGRTVKFSDVIKFYGWR
jgi:hypothetical protein